MKVGKLAIAAVAASALVLAGCSSSDSDSAAESTDDAGASEDSGDSGGSGPKICMVTPVSYTHLTLPTKRIV